MSLVYANKSIIGSVGKDRFGAMVPFLLYVNQTVARWRHHLYTVMLIYKAVIFANLIGFLGLYGIPSKTIRVVAATSSPASSYDFKTEPNFCEL